MTPDEEADAMLAEMGLAPAGGQSEADAMLSDMGFTPAQRTGTGEAFVMGGVQGGTLGHGEEAEALVRSAADAQVTRQSAQEQYDAMQEPKPKTAGFLDRLEAALNRGSRAYGEHGVVTPGEQFAHDVGQAPDGSYEAHREQAQQRHAAAAEEHPFAYGGGQVAGAVLLGGKTRGMLPKGWKGSAAHGGILSAGTAVGDAEIVGDGQSMEDPLVLEMIKRGATGAAFGVGGDAGGKLLSIPFGWAKTGLQKASGSFGRHGDKLKAMKELDDAKHAVKVERADYAKAGQPVPSGWTKTRSNLADADAKMSSARRAVDADPGARFLDRLRRSSESVLPSTVLSTAKNLASKAILREALSSPEAAHAVSSRLLDYVMRTAKAQRYLPILTSGVASGAGAADALDDPQSLVLTHLELLDTDPEYAALFNEEPQE